MLDNLRIEVRQLIPSSLLDDLVCFVLYDHHPRDEKNIDITICTKNGRVIEIFQRDVLSTFNLNCKGQALHITILRNNESELFYLVSTVGELIIVSSKDKLKIHKTIPNVQKYDVSDTACSGLTCLKVFRNDDELPLVLDGGNFKSVEDVILNARNDDTASVITNLKRKLVELRYSTQSNESTYKQYTNLRQRANMLLFQNLCPNTNDSVFKDSSKSVPGSLKLISQKPTVKACNKKIVIILHALNESKDPIENVDMLVNHATILSLLYTTKLFVKTPTSPFWEETNTYKLKPNEEYALVAVIAMEEVKLVITNGIRLSGAMSYKMSSKEYLHPFEDVVVSSLDSMGDEFDMLSGSNAGDRYTILAILATTEQTELCLRHIRSEGDSEVSLLDLFCEHLKMQKVEKANNVIVYKESPYHVLDGTMIVFREDNSSEKAVSVSVHTRSPSQVLALIHYIYDAVPAKIVATTPTVKITNKTEDLSRYNEEICLIPVEKLNYMDYATSILNVTGKILEHLDNSMIKMNESKNPSVRRKVGSHIDLFASGVDKFKEFKVNVLEDAKKGINSFLKLGSIDDKETEEMIVD